MTSRSGPQPVSVGFGLAGGFVVGAAVVDSTVVGVGSGSCVVGEGDGAAVVVTSAVGLGLAVVAAAAATGLLASFFGDPDTVPMMNINTRNPTTPDTDHTVIFFRRDHPRIESGSLCNGMSAPKAQ